MRGSKGLGLLAAMGAVGALTLSLPTAASASVGCDAANAGAFTTSAPQNTNRLTQFNTSFSVGDMLTVTATGTPTGVGVDLFPGPQTVLVVNGANGTGSVTVNNAGPHTLDITLAASNAGDAFLHFSCIPAPSGGGSGGGGAHGSGGGSGGPDATDQSQTITNSTTSIILVENRTVQGFLSDAVSQNPELPTDVPPPAAANLPSPIIFELQSQLLTLEVKEQELKLKLDALRVQLATIKTEFEQNVGNTSTQGSGADKAWGEAVRRLVPIDAESALAESTEREKKAEQRELWEQQRTIEADIASTEKELADVSKDVDTVRTMLPPTPEPQDFTPATPDDLGDSESLLFAPFDPFQRALSRYRGFDLANAVTGEEPAITPLSTTRTLDPTTVVWARAAYTDFEQNDASQQDGTDFLVAVGAHRDIADDLRLGLFATAKWGEVTSPINNLDIDSRGYSIGAYGRYMLDEIALNASTRLGVTRNDISIGGVTGSYDTRLASATIGASGEDKLAHNVWLRPAISTTLTWVNREDYRNSAGTNISGATNWSGDITAGPTVGITLTPPAGLTRLEPALGLAATYTWSNQDNQSGTVTVSEDDYLSLSIAPQLSLGFEGGGNLDLCGSYFGIGADLDGWSVGGTFSIPLN